MSDLLQSPSSPPSSWAARIAVLRRSAPAKCPRVPALIAAETGVAVVSDFRRADCAAGGQGVVAILER